MKSQGFVKLLRKVIREEVRSAVKEILAEERTDHKQVIDHGMSLAEIAENPMPGRRVSKKKKFTKDSMLNDILNETAANGDFASMKQGGMYTSDMAPSFARPGKTQTLATTDTNGKPVDMNNQNVASVMNAMTRDYSGLIKAIDKKNGKMGTTK